MRLVSKLGKKCLGWGLLASVLTSSAWALNGVPTTPQCKKPVYLTFDTGHMGVAPLISQVLQKHQVPVTYFAAHEKTQEGDGTLGQHWAPWWKAQAANGHDFASHTYDHAYWRADIDAQHFKIRPSAGEQNGQNLNWHAADYCANLKKASDRLEVMTGRKA